MKCRQFLRACVFIERVNAMGITSIKNLFPSPGGNAINSEIVFNKTFANPRQPSAEVLSFVIEAKLKYRVSVTVNV